MRQPECGRVEERTGESAHQRTISASAPAARHPWQDLGVELKAHVTITSVEEPPKRAAGIKVESVDELVDKLRNEAKVIQ